MKGFCTFLFLTALFMPSFADLDYLSCSPSGRCPYGETINVFSRLAECCKAPGSVCGGFLQRNGRCGNGLTCMCDLCTGCSSDTYECFSQERCKTDFGDHLNFPESEKINPNSFSNKF